MKDPKQWLVALSPRPLALIAAGVIAIALIYGSWTLWQRRESILRQRGAAFECSKNLQELSKALHNFASGHDGHFPNEMSELIANGYIDSPHLLVCPGDGISKKEAAGAKVGQYASYIYLGRGLTLNDSAKLPLLVEPPGHHPGGVGNVLLLGGFVERVDMPTIRSIMITAQKKNTEERDGDEFLLPSTNGPAQR